MTRVAIGVAVHAEPEGLLATLASLERSTPGSQERIVLPDGADDATRRALSGLAGVRVLEDPGAQGGAACLNRLARSTEAGVLVLLESGCRVGPGWLEALLAPLDASPRAGLAGPSTNRSWNEQCVLGDAEGSEEGLARAAALMRARFGDAARTLAPLHSLADFCYAVRREVLDAVGGADEGYGLGPCWEMDLNVRAARAGFDGLWACGAWVWRAPFTARRRQEEAARFEASRHRYQEKFCGARRRGVRREYHAHCRGDACPDFAPRAPPATGGAAPGGGSWPLVSCIMPTFDRRRFIPQAVAGFLSQDYPSLELVVVDDGTDPIADLLPSDPRVTYVRLDGRRPVGAKRNLACDRARGEIVVHWDDDDWYPCSRVRIQVQALLERGADVCGTSILHFVDPARERAFTYRYTGGGMPWVAGNTLAYRRDAWRPRRFQEVQVGEDANFVWSFPPEKVLDLRSPGLCVATVHAGNVSPKDTSGVYWSPEPIETIRAVMACGTAESPLARAPLVSCIMPTFDRRAFIPLALACFREQTYPNRELVVIDDGRDAVGDLLREEPAVRYVRVEGRLRIGAKRNRACAEARGELLAHWDDDDWYARDRLERQVVPILRGDADITGLENRFVLQLPHRRFWTVDPRLHRSMFVGDVHGGTLVYRRSIWTGGLRYPEVDLAEDAMLLQQALARGMRLSKLANEGTFVYTRHSANAWKFDAGSFLDPSGWREAPGPAGFTADRLDAYTAAAARVAG